MARGSKATKQNMTNKQAWLSTVLRFPAVLVSISSSSKAPEAELVRKDHHWFFTKGWLGNTVSVVSASMLCMSANHLNNGHQQHQ